MNSTKWATWTATLNKKEILKWRSICVALDFIVVSKVTSIHTWKLTFQAVGATGKKKQKKTIQECSKEYTNTKFEGRTTKLRQTHQQTDDQDVIRMYQPDYTGATSTSCHTSNWLGSSLQRDQGCVSSKILEAILASMCDFLCFNRISWIDPMSDTTPYFGRGLKQS